MSATGLPGSGTGGHGSRVILLEPVRAIGGKVSKKLFTSSPGALGKFSGLSEPHSSFV